MARLQNALRAVLPESIRPVGYLTRLTQRKTGGVIASGPFKGVKYVKNSFGSAYIPKLLGIYERELAPAIASIVRRQPELLVDVGAAEGYYAVGIATVLPNAHIIAFEAQEGGQILLQQMIGANCVGGRVKVRGWCGPDDLNEALGNYGNTAIVMDAEGAELDLIDLKRVPYLRHAELLIETHEFIVPGVTERLVGRLKESHRILIIHQIESRR